MEVGIVRKPDQQIDINNTYTLGYVSYTLYYFAELAAGPLLLGRSGASSTNIVCGHLYKYVLLHKCERGPGVAPGWWL